MHPTVDPPAQLRDEIPDASHYTCDYLGTDASRLTSYRLQVATALAAHASTALVVGKGDGLVANILEMVGIAATTLDIQPDLNPDICASVLHIPVSNESFDVVLCCQVLEHLPFSELSNASAELRRVSRRRVVISLPDQRRYIGVRIGYRMRSWNLGLSLPPLRKRAMPSFRRDVAGHHWEIGYKGSSYSEVKAALVSGGLPVSRCVRNPDLPWHTFFISDLAVAS